MPSDIGLVAALLSRIFGWAVDPAGLAAMALNHQLEVIHSGVKVALDQRDFAAVDLLLQQLRELSNRAP